jgi:MFS family permease
VAISPTFITAFGLIERRVPAAVLTEGVTWVMTGIGIGMALGAFVAGWVVDTLGPRAMAFGCRSGRRSPRRACPGRKAGGQTRSRTRRRWVTPIRSGRRPS